ncbi:MAG: methyltransferase domain-containing protein [Rhodospirillaceae bacterium]|jgi:cyclopropane fatty-acyl-phospholipid synthase-like methyltransferase|nr:methyltransferase domain-containing protein [Rhodospirillaceae bacterium]
MNFEKLEDFYQVYDQHRTYVKAEIRKKHIRNYDDQYWRPAQGSASHSVLELGTGVGLFLAYLKAKGVNKFTGIDSDPKVKEYMPQEISENVIIGDIWTEIQNFSEPFDRIVLLDVFEHFSFMEGQRLLVQLKDLLEPDGKIVLRAPNAASPFGLQYQYNDVTHKAIYGPGNLQHVALAAGLQVEKFQSVRRGSYFKRFLENIVLGFLDKVLTEPPPLWGANMIAVLSSSSDN